MKNRILVLAHSASIGGAELALASLIESTTKTCEWIVVFADTKKASIKLTKNAKRVEYLELPWWCYEAHDKPRTISEKVLQKNISKLELLAKSADVLLTNTITIPWLGFIAHKVNKPHVWYIHEFGDIDHNLQFIQGYKETLQTISDCSDRVLTISTAVSEHITKVIPKNKVDIIHQSIDFDKVLKIPLVKSSFQKQIRLLCLGAIKPSKGQAIAVEAMKLLKHKVEAKLDIVGPAADPIYVRNLLSSADEYTQVEPRAYDIYEELSTHDVVLMCSENEALGRVTLEALAAGKLVIGYGCTATKELLSDDRGVIYSPNSSLALADAILYGLGKSRIIDRAKNRAFVVGSFSREQQSKDFLDCIVKVAQDDETPSTSSLEVYWQIIRDKRLFLSPVSSSRKKLKQTIGKFVPNKIKPLIKKHLKNT